MIEVQAALQEVFRQVFDDDDLSITEATSAADINGWDSMAHINLIIAIEKKFGVSFSANEISKLGRRGQTVGNMIQILAAKIGQGPS
jgi:acyl carrier protein